MADLIRVRFKSGTESTVSAEYIARWPEDIAVVLDGGELDSAESIPEPTPVQVTKVASIKEKK